MADDKDTVIIDLKVVESGTPVPTATKEVAALSTSILGLQKSSKALRDERKLLDTSTKEGTDRIKEINAQIDANDKAIKKNSSSLEQQRLNIGNYKGALDKLIPGLGATADGFIQIGKSIYTAFIANPVGVILAGIALALAGLIKLFTSTEEGGDKLAKIMAQVSATFNVLIDRVTQFATGFAALLSGDISEGIDKMGKSFQGVGDEIEREVKVAGDLADAIDKLEERELKFGLATGETANQIKELILQSKNRSKTEQERIDLTNKAIALEIDQNNKRKAIDEEDIRIAATKLQQRNNQFEVEQKAGESSIDFAKRIIDNDKIIIADRQELADKVDKYNQAEGESIGILEKVQNQQDALNDKLQAQIDKYTQLEQKFKASAQAYVDGEDAKIAATLETEEAQLKAEADASNAADAKRKQDEEDYAFQRKLKQDELADDTKYQLAVVKNAEKTAEIKKSVELSTAQFVAQMLGIASGLFRQNTIEYKTLASAQALINAGVAISRAYMDYEYPASLFVSILAGAGALAAVAKINDVQFAEGGEYAPSKYVKVGGRSHAQGGTKYRGEDGNGFEVEQGEGIYILKRNAEADKINRLSALNMSHGGNSFGRSTWYAAQGGQIETRNVGGLTSSAEIERVVRTTMQNMPPIIVTVEDINAKSQQVGNIVQQAKVVG